MGEFIIRIYDKKDRPMRFSKSLMEKIIIEVDGRTVNASMAESSDTEMTINIADEILEELPDQE